MLIFAVDPRRKTLSLNKLAVNAGFNCSSNSLNEGFKFVITTQSTFSPNDRVHIRSILPSVGRARPHIGLDCLLRRLARAYIGLDYLLSSFARAHIGLDCLLSSLARAHIGLDCLLRRLARVYIGLDCPQAGRGLQPRS